jgi:hypothetical protein
MLPASELKLAASATAGKFSSADRFTLCLTIDRGLATKVTGKGAFVCTGLYAMRNVVESTQFTVTECKKCRKQMGPQRSRVSSFCAGNRDTELKNI